MTFGPLGYVATLPRDKACFCNVKQKKALLCSAGNRTPVSRMTSRILYFFHGNKLCACVVASCVPHAYHGQLVIKYKSYLIKYSTDVRCIPDPFFYIPDHSPTFIRLKLEYIPTITRIQTLTSYYKTNHTRFLIMWHPSTRGPTRVRQVQTLLGLKNSTQDHAVKKRLMP